MRKVWSTIITVALIVGTQLAWAAGAFVIRQIDVQGLQHIPRATVDHYLPVKVGQTYSTTKGNAIITDLYRTGFFNEVNLARQGNILIIKVQEKPTIGDIKFIGNSAIHEDQLKQVQQNAGLVIGRIFNPANLKAVTEGLKQEYISQGYYNATVETEIKQMPDNMVEVYVNIDQGSIARVQQITILGNESFTEAHLLHLFKLSTPNLFSFFTDSDHYSPDKLDADLQTLHNFYLDHGYLRFNIVSKQVTITPDGAGVYITIRISEGAQYTVSDVVLPASLNPKYRGEISGLVMDMKGELFSRQHVLDINNQIADYLGNDGYAFPNINAVPVLDDVHHTVVLNYQIFSGEREYVRDINFVGNGNTQDMVLRYNMRQMEGELYNTAKIKESKRRLANLPFISNTDIEEQAEPVPGHPDEVDLNYKIKETNAGQANVMGGYSDLVGFLYGATLSQTNLFGTGRVGSVSFQRSAYSDQYTLAYNNPYYTIYGLSRGFDFNYTHITPGAVNLSSYTQDVFSFDVNYGMPISEYNTLTFGYGYSYNYIGLDPGETPTEIVNFVSEHGHTFNEVNFNGGWNHSTLDRIIFPTEGLTESIGLNLYTPADSKSLTYYKTEYAAGYFQPINRLHTYVLNFHTSLGYGDGLFGTDGLPFFANYYGGGIGTVPGYTGNTLGPKSTSPPAAVGTALGGNVILVAGSDFIFPNPISDSVRTELTFNAGNVYGSGQQINLDQLRYSAGLMVIWRSPFGPLDFSLAKALNAQSGDDLSPFQFTMGASFS